MSGIFSGINMFLLQYNQRITFKEDNPREGYILIIVIGAVIVVSILFHIIRNGMSPSVAGKGKTSVTPRKFKAFSLYRIASAYGLDREQTKLLEYVFRTSSVNDPGARGW